MGTFTPEEIQDQIADMPQVPEVKQVGDSNKKRRGSKHQRYRRGLGFDFCRFSKETFT